MYTILPEGETCTAYGVKKKTNQNTTLCKLSEVVYYLWKLRMFEMGLNVILRD